MKQISLIKIVTAIITSLLVNNFYAQKPVEKIRPLFGTDVFSTGNGYGAFFSLNAGIVKGKNIFSVSPIIQKCSMKTHGFRMRYSRVLTFNPDQTNTYSQKDLLQLNFFSSFQYTDKLPLCPSALKREELIWGDAKPNLDKILLTTGELTVGFELYVNITNQISWKNYAGASVYYNFKYHEALDHQRIAPTLALGTGICIFL